MSGDGPRFPEFRISTSDQGGSPEKSAALAEALKAFRVTFDQYMARFSEEPTERAAANVFASADHVWSLALREFPRPNSFVAFNIAAAVSGMTGALRGQFETAPHSVKAVRRLVEGVRRWTLRAWEYRHEGPPNRVADVIAAAIEAELACSWFSIVTTEKLGALERAAKWAIRIHAREIVGATGANLMRIATAAVIVEQRRSEIEPDQQRQIAAIRQMRAWIADVWRLAGEAPEESRTYLINAALAFVHAEFRQTLRMSENSPSFEGHLDAILSVIHHLPSDFIQLPFQDTRSFDLAFCVAYAAHEKSHFIDPQSGDRHEVLGTTNGEYVRLAAEWSDGIWQNRSFDRGVAVIALRFWLCSSRRLIEANPSGRVRDRLFSSIEERTRWIIEKTKPSQGGPEMLAATFALGSMVWWARDLRARAIAAKSHGVFSAIADLIGMTEADLPVADVRVELASHLLEMLADAARKPFRCAEIPAPVFQRAVAGLLADRVNTDNLEEFVRELEQALAVARWFRCESDLLGAITDELMRSGVSLSSRRRAEAKGPMFIDSTLATTKNPWRSAAIDRRIRLLFNMSLARALGDSRELRAIEKLRQYDSVLEDIAEDFVNLTAGDFRYHCVAALGVVFQMAIETAWDLFCGRVFQSADDVVSRILQVQCLNDLHLRLRSQRGGTVVGTRPNLPSRTELFAAAVQLTDQEDRTIAVFFDTGSHLLRAVFTPGRPVALTAMKGDIFGRYSDYRASLNRLDQCIAEDIGRWTGGQLLLSRVDALCDLLVNDLPGNRLTVLPHGFTHDALAAAAWRWADRRGFDRPTRVEQSPSLGASIELRARDAELARARVLAARPMVLVVVADDIAPYRDDVIHRLRELLRCRSDLYEYRVRPPSGRRSGASGYRPELLRIHADREEVVNSPQRKTLRPHVCIWLVHGESRELDDLAAPGCSFLLDAGVPEAWMRIGADEIANPNGLRLPALRRGDRVDPLGLTVSFDRCALTLNGACSSGYISERLGEDAAGLVRPFLMARIPCVVAMSWNVPMAFDAGARAEALWGGLIERMLPPHCEVMTIGDAVYSARAIASRPRSNPLTGVPDVADASHFAEWGGLTLFGCGDVRSPWASS